MKNPDPFLDVAKTIFVCQFSERIYRLQNMTPQNNKKKIYT